MTNPPFDLAERTQLFASSIREFIKSLPQASINYKDIDQLVRSSGSVAANYIEADEAVSKPDFLYRIKICKKECRESILWLSLLSIPEAFEATRKSLMNEGNQLVKIFYTISRNTKV